MSEWKPCPACAGTGTIEVPSIREKIARHLIYAAANKERGPFALGLAPEEVEAIGVELGILPRPAPDAPAAAAPPDVAAGVDPYAIPPNRIPPAPSQPIEAEARAAVGPEAPVPFDAFAPAAAAELDEDAPPPYFPPEPSRPAGVPTGPTTELPGHVLIQPVEQPWQPVSGVPAPPGTPAPGIPGAPGVSLTGPPGGA